MKTNSRVGVCARAAVRLAAGTCLLTLARPPLQADADDATAPPAPSRVSVQDGMAVVKLKPDEIKRTGLEVTALAPTTHRPSQPALAAVLDLQTLFDSAAAFAAVRADAGRTAAALAASRAEYERARKLHDENQNFSTKDLQAAEAAYRADGAAAQAAAAVLQARRAALAQQWGPQLAAWIADGTPEYQRLLKGEQRLVRVTQAGSRHRANPPEEASLQRQDGKWAKATLISPTGQASPEFQTEGWYFLVDAAGMLPGLNVDALLPADSADVRTGVMIPSAAVIWTQGRAWVYVQTAAGVFARREIATDQPDAMSGYFVTGFPADHPVVIKGAQVLLSEENKPAGAED